MKNYCENSIIMEPSGFIKQGEFLENWTAVGCCRRSLLTGVRQFVGPK